MKILLDMNLSPSLCPILLQHGHEAAHWSAVGNPCATDREIMEWAQANEYIVLTHDLDFGAILAATQARGPSVIQVRTQDALGDRLGLLLVKAIDEHRGALEAGALVAIDESRSRIRVLPLQRQDTQ